MSDKLASDVGESNLSVKKNPENWKIFISLVDNSIVESGPYPTLPAALREIPVIHRRLNMVTIKSIEFQNSQI